MEEAKVEMKNRILIGIIAIAFAVIMITLNGISMQNEMVKIQTVQTIKLEHEFNYMTETGWNETVGAVSDFNSDLGTHDSMLAISYSNENPTIVLTFNTFNETAGLATQAKDTFNGDIGLVYKFEPRNNTAVLNDTLYFDWCVYAGNLNGIGGDEQTYSINNPEPLVGQYPVAMGYYVNSADYDPYNTGSRVNSMNYSIVNYQGFIVESVEGALIYYTGLMRTPIAHIIDLGQDGCQVNCIYQNELWFASDDNLYELSGSILNPTIDSYSIHKSNQRVTALDVYVDDNGYSHLLICYNNCSTIYEFTGISVQPLITISQDLNIKSIENTRNYDGKFFISGITNDDTGFIAEITDVGAIASNEIATQNADANVMCNLTSEEELYVFNDLTDGSDYDCYHYDGNVIPPTPSQGAGITITLTKAGHWTTGESTSELYEHVGTDIAVNATVECADGIDNVDLYYQAVGETVFTSIAMTKTAGTYEDGTWSVDVPAQDKVGDVLFKIRAISTLGDVHTTPVYTLSIIASASGGGGNGGNNENPFGLPFALPFMADQNCCCLSLILLLLALLIAYIIYKIIKEKNKKKR